jgi:hypothetical protein
VSESDPTSAAAITHSCLLERAPVREGGYRQAGGERRVGMVSSRERARGDNEVSAYD